MFKPAAIFVGAAILLAGCSSTPTIPEETISSPPVMAGTNSALSWTDTNIVKKIPSARPLKPVVPTVRTNPPPSAPPSAPMMTWTSLDRWAAENKISLPHLIARTPVAAYAIGTAYGTMVLDIGSREAAWNGTEVNLGFAPEFIDDQVFVHGADLRKDIEPLLLGSALSFGNHVIVIDPGHGGSNVGTRSVLDGRFEKEFTLDWAKRLAPLLETNGWKVFLTRTSDVTVSNLDRVVFAEAHHADLFISLHFNSGAPDKKPSGLQTYCLTPIGMPSTITRGWPDLWSQVYPNNAYDAQNLQLAVRVHSAVLRATGLEDRGVCHSRFDTVLRGQNRPAILIEGGFMSNPHEAKLIESPEFRQKLAEAVADALK
ncbi:MAG: N-acetylmuramoyl-L-alanine amidase [Verrucomicrobiia bacterium]